MMEVTIFTNTPKTIILNAKIMNADQSSPIALGTAAIGRPHYINIRQEEKAAFSMDTFRQKGWEVLDTAYDQGVRYFDTAPGYGMAEQLMLDWVSEKKDADIEIATKWGYTYTANFDPNATQHEVKEHSLAKLNEQWESSQQLLPWLTTYQIHSATFDTGVLENQAVLHRLAELKDKYGLLIGLTASGSNQGDIIQKSIEIEVEGSPLFDVFQITYNIFDQSMADLANQLFKEQKRLVIKEALANGRVFPNDRYPHYQKAYQLLNELALKYAVGTDAIALRFCIDSIPVFKVLSGAANQQHLSDNLKANDFQLADHELEALKALAITPETYWNERKQLGWN
jgi:aryl-alcohol dehydrogenase-like predicted oxidoreductase